MTALPESIISKIMMYVSHPVADLYKKHVRIERRKKYDNTEYLKIHIGFKYWIVREEDEENTRESMEANYELTKHINKIKRDMVAKLREEEHIQLDYEHPEYWGADGRPAESSDEDPDI